MRTSVVLAAAWLVGALGAGCASVPPPERLVAVSAELEQAGAQELAELQPNLVREARDHRDAAWAAAEDGDEGLAEAHAWAAWLRLRTAENVDVIGRRDALVVGSAESAPAAEATGGDGGAQVLAPTDGAPAVSAGSAAGGGEAGAARAVRDAEDAMLRLLATGLEPDPRWSEAQALLQAAQRALERGELERAEALGERASFVFEMVRLTRLGGSGYAAADAGGDEALAPRGLAAPGGALGPPSPVAPAGPGPLTPGSATPASSTPPTTPSRGVPSASSPGAAGAASPDITVNVPGGGPSFIPVPSGSGQPTVVVVPGAPPAPASSEPSVGEGAPDADSTPRSRIVTDVLQPFE